MRIITIIILFCNTVVPLWAQQPPDSTKTNWRLKVREDLLYLKATGLKKKEIYSASRKPEHFFDAPLASSVITQKMLQQTGVTNIVEALRLIPGLLVHQKTNGNYEVNIRHSFSAANSLLSDQKNQQLLVVIDHMPQYDFLQGGVLWEALPVDIQDIERIEVVRTPSVVFFGSVAINGVIHIFTRQPQDEELKVAFSSQAGIAPSISQSNSKDPSMIHRGTISFGLSDKLRFRISGNYQLLGRFQEEYFLLSENRYIAKDSLLFFKQNAFETNLNTKIARESLGVNAFVFYKHSDKAFVSTQLSFQESEVQTILSDDTLALANRQSKTVGVNLNAYLHNFHLNISQNLGKRDYAVGYSSNSFQVNQTQASLNYTYSSKYLQILPGVGFLESKNTLSDRQNTLIENPIRFVGYHAFTKIDATILPKWRVLASIRGDMFEQAPSPYLSYQLSSSYKIKNQLIRASYTYNEGIPLTRQFRQNTSHYIPPGIQPNQTQTTEIGWNTRILTKINTYLEAFHNRTTFSQAFASTSAPDILTPTQVSFHQLGISAKAQAWFNKVQVEGFITVQRSASTLAELQNKFLKSTAQFYGGFQLNYTGFLGKLNANVQAYFYDDYQLNTQYGEITLPSRLLTNLMVSYQIWRENRLFINARGLLNGIQKEYAFADDIPGMYLLGIKINL